MLIPSSFNLHLFINLLISNNCDSLFRLPIKFLKEIYYSILYSISVGIGHRGGLGRDSSLIPG